MSQADRRTVAPLLKRVLHHSGLLALARIAPESRGPEAHAVTFRPGTSPPRDS